MWMHTRRWPVLRGGERQRDPGVHDVHLRDDRQLPRHPQAARHLALLDTRRQVSRSVGVTLPVLFQLLCAPNRSQRDSCLPSAVSFVSQLHRVGVSGRPPVPVQHQHPGPARAGAHPARNQILLRRRGKSGCLGALLELRTHDLVGSAQMSDGKIVAVSDDGRLRVVERAYEKNEPTGKSKVGAQRASISAGSQSGCSCCFRSTWS